MTGTQGASTPKEGFEGLPAQPDASLRMLYRGYRRRQLSSLLTLVPREAIRPLYRTARIWAVRHDAHEEKDPLATLLRYLEDVLPLPPFSVWRQDFMAHRDAHLAELDQAPAGMGDDVPVVMDLRQVTEKGRSWHAALSVFRRHDAWHGYVAFRADASGMSVRTADIFRAATSEEIRQRFREFDAETLKAFLRSTLP